MLTLKMQVTKNAQQGFLILKLYYTPKTRAQRVRWLLEECQLEYQLVYIDLFNGEGRSDSYLRIHPLGYVPVLEDQGFKISESAAIAQYITHKYAADRLQPVATSTDYMKYLQWMHFVPSTLEPPLWEIQLHSWILPKAKRSIDAINLAHERYEPIVKSVNDALSNSPYILGEYFSTADILLASTLSWHKKSLKQYPILNEYVDRLYKRPAYLKALDE